MLLMMKKGLPIERHGESLAEIDINDMFPEGNIKCMYV